MHITLLAVGTRGDVQPYVALGLGLKEAGHDVRVATHEVFKELILGNGLEFAPLKVDIQAVMSGPDGLRWIQSGGNQLRFVLRMIRLAYPTLRQMLDDSWVVCQGTQAILYSTFAIAGYSIAEALGIPSMAAPLQPLTRTRVFPIMMSLPQRFSLSGRFNRLSYLIGEQFLWQPFRMAINRWRRDRLSLPPIPFGGPFGHLYRERYPWIYGFSPSVIPRPPDWPDWVHVSGYWFLELQKDWSPPARVLDFLAAGPPPVCIGFGSMIDRDQAELMRMAVQALDQARQRGILLTGWGGMEELALPQEVLVLESIPHEWLLPRMAAVVHHGGAGTTAAALRSGVPSIITPFFADQPFWGQVVARLRVGPAPIMRSKLTTERLAEAIRVATSDEGMKARAKALGERIQAEKGVKRAVQIVEGYLNS
jgi:sterol 3beta-glucosyltransferase